MLHYFDRSNSIVFILWFVMHRMAYYIKIAQNLCMNCSGTPEKMLFKYSLKWNKLLSTLKYEKKKITMKYK